MIKEINKIISFYKKTYPNLPSQTFTLVFFTYVTYLNITYFKYMYISSFDQTCYIIISSFLYFMATFTYFLASLTNPSQNNLDPIINQISDGNTFYIDNKQFQQKCDFCKMKKHDRSSHCSICGVCILRRDHHCVFIGTCVGLKNTRYFLHFLFWSLV